MNRPSFPFDRRRFLGGSLALGFGAAAFGTARGAFAEELARTPRLTEGPFYPPKLPLDTDNDLIIINNSITPAVGEVTHLTGRVLERQRRADPECDRRDLAVRQQGRLPRPGTQRAETTRTSRGSAGSSPARPASITSGPSSRSRTPAARRTSTSRSRRAARNCSPRSCSSTATRRTRRTASSRPPRSARTGARPGRFQAVQGLENRRTGGPLRHRGRPDPRGAARGPACDNLAERGVEPNAVPFSTLIRRTMDVRKLLRFPLAVVCAAALLSWAAAQPPAGRPADDAPKDKAKDYSNAPLVVRMMAFDKKKDGKLTRDEVTDERLQRLFDQADTNKDGVVTKEELMALAAKLDAEGRRVALGGSRSGRPRRSRPRRPRPRRPRPRRSRRSRRPRRSRRSWRPRRRRRGPARFCQRSSRTR